MMLSFYSEKANTSGIRVAAKVGSAAFLHFIFLVYGTPGDRGIEEIFIS